MFIILIAFLFGCSKGSNHKNVWVSMNYMGSDSEIIYDLSINFLKGFKWK